MAPLSSVRATISGKRAASPLRTSPHVRM